MMDQNITFRFITREDKNFLRSLYASTREEELALTDWDDLQKEAFIGMQFEAQHSFYHEQFPNAEFQLILLDKEPIGRLYIDKREDEFRIIDIALLKEYRNKGIGSTLLKDILSRSSLASLPVRIHVEQFNPALTLYNRLGFHRIEENGVYYLMEWRPTASEVT